MGGGVMIVLESDGISESVINERIYPTRRKGIKGTPFFLLRIAYVIPRTEANIRDRLKE